MCLFHHWLFFLISEPTFTFNILIIKHTVVVCCSSSTFSCLSYISCFGLVNLSSCNGALFEDVHTRIYLFIHITQHRSRRDLYWWNVTSFYGKKYVYDRLKAAKFIFHVAFVCIHTTSTSHIINIFFDYIEAFHISSQFIYLSRE